MRDRFRRDVSEVKIPQIMQFHLGQEVQVEISSTVNPRMGDIFLCRVGEAETACEVVHVTDTKTLGMILVTVKRIQSQ